MVCSLTRRKPRNRRATVGVCFDSNFELRISHIKNIDLAEFKHNRRVYATSEMARAAFRTPSQAEAFDFGSNLVHLNKSLYKATLLTTGSHATVV